MAKAEYALTMARYNAWQNRNLLRATAQLPPEGRALDRGAFFGSIEATFYHLLWADRMWMSRFKGTRPPEGGIPGSTRFDGSWDEFCGQRAAMDREVLDWAGQLDAAWFAEDLVWFSGALGREISRPRTVIVMHLFNHQTHHRGQIHAMLTAAGVRPDDTDLAFMPEHPEIL